MIWYQRNSRQELLLSASFKSQGNTCQNRAQKAYKISLFLLSSSSSSVICQTTGPKLLPKRFLHIVRSRASSFNWQHPLLSLRSSSSFLRLLPRLLVASICPFIFPSITCFRRQFLRKMWPIQLTFRFLISCRIFLCWLTLSNIYYSGNYFKTVETRPNFIPLSEKTNHSFIFSGNRKQKLKISFL